MDEPLELGEDFEDADVGMETGNTSRHQVLDCFEADISRLSDRSVSTPSCLVCDILVLSPHCQNEEDVSVLADQEQQQQEHERGMDEQGNPATDHQNIEESDPLRAEERRLKVRLRVA